MQEDPFPGPTAATDRRGSSLTRRTAALGGIVAAALLLTAVWILLPDRRGERIIAPVPEGTEAAPSLPELPPSSLHLSVLLGFQQVQEVLEEEVPTRFGDLSQRRPHSSVRGLAFAFEAEREPLHLRVRGDTAFLDLVLQYQGRAWYDAPLIGELTASCAELEGARPRARITLTSPLELDGEWGLRSRVRVDTVEPLTSEERDRCRLSTLGLDITDALLAAAEDLMEEWSPRVDAAVADLHIRTPVERYWEELRRPVALAEDVWLILDPMAVSGAGLGAVPGDGDGARVDVGLLVRPRIVTGPEPAVPERPLPPPGDGPPGEGFRLVVDGTLDYRRATQVLAEAIGGRELDLGGRSVRLHDMEVTGLGDGRVALQVEMEGDLRGRLYLVGTPRYDPQVRRITVPDLDFHVATRNLLVRSGAWVLRVGFPERIRRHAVWSVDPVLERVRAGVREGLDRELPGGTRLEGRLDSLAVMDVAAGRRGLVVRSRWEGVARLLVEGEDR